LQLRIFVPSVTVTPKNGCEALVSGYDKSSILYLHLLVCVVY